MKWYRTPTIFEWWQGADGQGYWHAKRGGRIIFTGGEGYARVRDAKRAMKRVAERTDGRLRIQPRYSFPKIKGR